MPLISNTDILSISTALGAADAAFVSATDTTQSTSPAAYLKAARIQVHADSADADYDNALAWETALRKVELSLPTSLGPILASTCAATDAYYIAQTGNKLRINFKAVTGWTNAFRALWRKSLKEEIIVRIWSFTNTSGTWGAIAPDKAIMLDTALEIHAVSAVTSAITLNLILLHANATTNLVTLTIPAGTLAGTVFPIGTVAAASKWVGTQSVGTSGGEAGDIIELWVS